MLLLVPTVDRTSALTDEPCTLRFFDPCPLWLLPSRKLWLEKYSEWIIKPLIRADKGIPAKK